MPYNVFYIAFFAVVLGIAVALLTRFGKAAEKQPVLPEPAFEARGEHAFSHPVGAEELRALATRLLGRYGIEVEGETRVSDTDYYLLGVSDDPVVGGRYVVHCHVGGADEVLPPEPILEFRDFVRAQGMTRGIYLTTGYFAKESRFLVEDAPVSLLSRGDVKELLETA